jgi:hypothetical protein
VIVIVGPVAVRGAGPDAEPHGLAPTTAVAAAAAGARVELIARVGDDPAGDDLLVALARASVGHVAVLRDAAHATLALAPDEADGDVASDTPGLDPSAGTTGATVLTLDAADVALALRYLTDFRVVVLVHPSSEAVVSEVAAAAAWAGAHVVALLAPGDPPAAGLPPEALVLEVMSSNEDVGGLVGHYAAAIDRGDPPADAFAALRAEVGA